MAACFMPKCGEHLGPFAVTAAAISWIFGGPGTVINALCTSSPSIFKQPSRTTIPELPVQNGLGGEVTCLPGTPPVSSRTGPGNQTFLKARPPQALQALALSAHAFLRIWEWLQQPHLPFGVPAALKVRHLPHCKPILALDFFFELVQECRFADFGNVPIYK